MKALVFALALFVSGCAAHIPNPITGSRLDIVNASWGATLAIAVNYRDACAERLIPPSCRTIVPRLQRAAMPVQAQVDKANQASTRSTVNAAELVSYASDAINDFKILLMELGVMK